MATVNVTFKIQNQGNGLQQISADAEVLKKVLGATAVEVTGLKKEIVSFAAASVMLDKFGNALGSLQSVCSELSRLLTR